MLDDMQFGGFWTLSRLKQKKTENRKQKTIKRNLIKSENYQEKKPWSQAHIHLQKSELIMETKHQFIF
jgi:hypothetical protein